MLLLASVSPFKSILIVPPPFCSGRLFLSPSLRLSGCRNTVITLARPIFKALLVEVLFSTSKNATKRAFAANYFLKPDVIYRLEMATAPVDTLVSTHIKSLLVSWVASMCSCVFRFCYGVVSATLCLLAEWGILCAVVQGREVGL